MLFKHYYIKKIKTASIIEKCVLNMQRKTDFKSKYYFKRYVMFKSVKIIQLQSLQTELFFAGICLTRL